MLKHILPRIPKHDTYIEPFGGGLAVLLAKPPAPVEVVNDRNADLINFYRYVKYHFPALKTELAGHLQSRQAFADLRANPGLTDLQRATRWFLLKVCSFAGDSTSWGRSKKSFHGFDESRHLRLIEAVHERLRRVYIESLDWEEVVAFYDSPTALTYFDPPYITGDAGASYDAFSEFDMQRLRARLDKMRGQWILSCDDSPQCRAIFGGLPSLSIPIRYAMTGRAGKRPQSSELLILSPGIAAREARAA